MSGTQITALPDSLTVGGGLDLSGTQITALPDNLTCESLYLDVEHIQNISWRKNCGYSNRTIFAVWTQGNFNIAAGCFFGPLDVFENRVTEKYGSGSAGAAYKRAAQECIAELTEKLNKSGADNGL